MSHQPFNSPRHAIRWLTKRKVIDSVEGLTVYQSTRFPKLYIDEVPSEDKLDDAAEVMLKRYGYSFKRPKARPLTGVMHSGIIFNDMMAAPTGRVLDTGWESPVGVSSIRIDEASVTRGFAPSPAAIEDYVNYSSSMHEEEMIRIERTTSSPHTSSPVGINEAMEETWNMVGGPDVSPPAAPQQVEALRAIFNNQAVGRVLEG